MRARIHTWKTLPTEHKDYVFIYAAGLIWALVYLLFSPPSTYAIIDRGIVIFWCSAAILGAILAVMGLLTRNNLLTERLGVNILAIAPIVYGLTQLGLFIAGFFIDIDDTFARLHLIFLALWIFLFMNKRRRLLKRQVTQAKNLPLISEGKREESE